jgi:hypothetical protein
VDTLEDILEEGEYEQLTTKIFVLRNEFMKKEHEIMHLETYLKSLKKNKEVVLEFFSKDDLLLAKVFNNCVSGLREKYCNISKQTINYKNSNKKSYKKLGQLKTEIDSIKNPQKYTKTYEEAETEKGGISGKTKTSTPPVKKTTENEAVELGKLDKAIEKNKTILDDLDTDVETYKKITFQLETENAELNRELTDKLSMIYMLEMKLAKLKNYK